MANTTLTPEQLAELVSRFSEVEKGIEDLAKAGSGMSAVFQSLGDFLKEPAKGGFVGSGPVKFNALYGIDTARPMSASTSTIQGRSANTVIMDEFGDPALDGVYERMKAEHEAKLAAERRAAEEREGHYKGDPLAGTF